MYQHDDAFVAWGNETLASGLYVDMDEVEKLKKEVVG
jgi:hypothetical protein